MKKIIKLEWNRMVRGKGFWIAFGISLIICIAQFVDYGLFIDDGYPEVLERGEAIVMESPLSIYLGWIGGELNSKTRYLFLLLLPILASLPHSASLLEDEETGFKNAVCTRVSKSDYIKGKYFITFLGAFLVIFVPVLLNIVLQSTVTSFITPTPESAMTEVQLPLVFFGQRLFFERPLLFLIFNSFQWGILGGYLAVMGMISYSIMPKKYFVVLFPFFIWKAADLIFQMTGFHSLMPSEYFSPPLGHFHPGISLGIFFLLFAGSAIPLWIRKGTL
ncbi:hypothetical protein ACTQ46_04405 [Gallicola sp. Sow4_E12]|uniref:hypothetical protein n=1 Tax=Gallicola sp. Sow4_E12 TaxID=3438785 RepID=UPI003F8FF00C